MSAAAVRSFERFTGTRLEVVEGCGRDGHGIVRTVVYWYDERGKLIRRDDHAAAVCEAEEPAPSQEGQEGQRWW